MKKDIHPKFYAEAKVTCACGNSFAVGSTKEKLEVEICSACHPFFTGQKKVLDTAGRVEKFMARQDKAKKLTATAKDKKKTAKPETKETKAKEKAKTKAKTADKKPAEKKAEKDKNPPAGGGK